MDFPELDRAIDRSSHERYTCSTSVLLLVGEHALPGTITNFSATGLLLQMDAPLADDLILVGAAATICGVSMVDASVGESDVNDSTVPPPLDAVVIHLEAKAVTFSLPKLPDDWWSFLGHPLATRQAESNVEVGAEVLSSEGNDEERDAYARLLDRCREIYLDSLRALTSELISRTIEKLGAIEGQNNYHAKRTELAEARHTLGSLGSMLIEKCVSLGDARFGSDAVRDEREWADGVPDADLRLMEADELEDYLAVSSSIKKCTELLRLEIELIETKLIRLTSRSVPFGKSAVAPESVLRETRNALAGVGISTAANRTLTTELDAVAPEHCRQLLNALSQVLSPVPTAPRLAQIDGVRSRAGLFGGATALTTAGRISDAAHDWLDSYRGGSSAASQPARSHRALRVLESLSKMAAREARAGQRIAPELVPLDSLAPASVDELIAAINELPTSQGSVFSSLPIDSLRESLRAPTSAQIAAPRELSPEHEGVIETSGALFQRAGTTLIANSDVEILLKRLEHTLLKLALRDGKFPSSPDHPGRQVINLIEQYNFAAADNGRLSDAKLRGSLESLVTRVCQQADDHPEVFSIVRENLRQDVDQLRRERRERVDRTVEALESRDRVRVARNAVDNALARRLAGRRLPRVFLRLLDDVWRQYSVMIGLRFGCESEPWRNCLDLIERTLAVASNGLAEPATAALRAELFRELSEVLGSAVSDVPLRDSLTQELRRLLLESEPSLVGDFVEAPQSLGPPQSSTRDSLSGVTIGSWWSLIRDDIGIPIQLVWTSEATGRRGLVNRSASNRLELTVDEFNEQLKRGQLRAIESLDVPLLDRSETSLLDEAYAETVRRTDMDTAAGVLNRRGLLRILREKNTLSGEGQHHVLVLIEFDQFRAVAAACGVDATDALAAALIASAAQRLPLDSKCGMYREDVLAVVLLDHGLAASERIAAQLCERLADFPYSYKQQSYRIGISIGLVEFVPGKTSVEELLRRADTACLAAKTSGRNRVRVYHASNEEVRNEESLIRWAGRVDSLFASDRLFIRAQAVMPISAAAGLLPGYELLLGVEPEAGESISPYEFVLALQRLGRAHELDLWVLDQAFRWMRDNADALLGIGGIAVNLSVASLAHPEISHYLRSALQNFRGPADKLVLEITESAAIHNFDAAEAFIRDMRRFGVRFSLDDFGSGYTSYAHLKRLSVDTLKIDGSYIRDIDRSKGRSVAERDIAIVRSMADVAHTLGMKVVAEWVESTEMLDQLIELGIDFAQGYAIHKPARLSEIVAPATSAP